MIVALLLGGLVALGSVFLAALLRTARDRGQLALCPEAVGLEALRWAVVAIVSYAAVMLLRSAARPPLRPDAAAGSFPSEGPAP